GRCQKLDALGAEFLVGLPAIGRLENTGRAELSAGEQRRDLRGGSFVVAAIGADLHQDQLKIGLPLRPDGEPAKAVVLLVFNLAVLRARSRTLRRSNRGCDRCAIGRRARPIGVPRAGRSRAIVPSALRIASRTGRSWYNRPGSTRR